MRWIVHIGAPKTGSTAIQRFLFDNRERLLAHGVHYPDVSLRGQGHHDLAFLLHGRYADWATPQRRTLADLSVLLRTEVRSACASTTVLSSEIFYLHPQPAALRGLLTAAGLRPQDEILIVCYVRRQDEAHVSWYNQTVKAQGNATSFAATRARDHDLWRYDKQLQPWRDEFGTGSIMVRDYTPFGRPPGDIRTDLLGILGLSPHLVDLPPVRANERINRDILELQRWVNRLPVKPQLKRRYHRRLIDLTTASADWGVFDDTPFLSPGARTALMQSYADGNAVLAQTYLGGSMLFDPVEDARGEAPDAAGHAGLTLAKVVCILRWIAGRRSPPDQRGDKDHVR